MKAISRLACLLILLCFIQIKFPLGVHSQETSVVFPAREEEPKEKDYKLSIPDYFETTLFSNEEMKKLTIWMEEFEPIVKKNWSCEQLKGKQTYSSKTIYNFLVDKYGNLKEIRKIFSNAIEQIDNSSYEALINSSRYKPLPVFKTFSDDQVVVFFDFYWTTNNEKKSYTPTKEEDIEIKNNAKKFLIDLASTGNSFVTYYVGTNYRTGKYTFEKDLDLGKKYIEDSANSGYIPALNYLAVIQAKELPDPNSSNQKILKQFTKAAEEGCISAQINLGRLYYHGKLIDKNLEKSRFWYEKAVNAGSTLAKHELDLLNKEIQQPKEESKDSKKE